MSFLLLWMVGHFVTVSGDSCRETASGDVTAGAAISTSDWFKGCAWAGSIFYWYPKSDRPSSGGSKPLVLAIHGGSFRYGDAHSDGMPAMIKTMVGYGWIGASLDYRLDGSSHWVDESMVDAKCAILAAHSTSTAARYNYNTSNIALMGDSAGAQLSIWLAYGSTRSRSYGAGLDSSLVKATIIISGTFNGHMSCTNPTYGNWNPTGCSCPSGCSKRGGFPDVAHNMRSGDAPLVTVVGQNDPLMPWVSGMCQQKYAYDNSMKRLYVEVSGGAHVPLLPWSMCPDDCSNANTAGLVNISRFSQEAGEFVAIWDHVDHSEQLQAIIDFVGKAQGMSCGDDGDIGDPFPNYASYGICDVQAHRRQREDVFV